MLDRAMWIRPAWRAAVKWREEARLILYLTHRPAPPLASFVDLLWYCENYEVEHTHERILPNGTAELVIALHDDRFREIDDDYAPALICGVHQRPIVIATSSLKGIIGVHFKPGGVRPFLHIPVTEANDRHVPLECFWGHAGRTLRERLLEAPTPQEKFAVLEAVLLAANPQPDRHAAVRYALSQFNRVPHVKTIGEVTDQTGFSARRFIQIFREEVGLTPKLFCRIQRFRHTLRRIAAGKPVRWAELASDCGYFDQAHFVHDFKGFSGINPTEYVERRTVWASHVQE